MHDRRADRLSVTAYTVATGPYITFWSGLAVEADRLLFPDSHLALVVFTDDAQQATRVASRLSRAAVDVLPVPSLGWPEATLLRYQLIAAHLEHNHPDVVLHLDADLKIHKPVGPALYPDTWHGGLALVSHPGFWRSRESRVGFRQNAADFRMRMLNAGGLGTWETRRSSLAHVARSHRKRYVCGGVWMGLSKAVHEMCRTLADRTEIDRRRGILARWHDESHLNWYAAHNDHTVLSPEYCHARKFAHLRHFEPIIEALDKGNWNRPGQISD